MSFVAKRNKTRWTVNHDNDDNHSKNNGASPAIPSNSPYVFH